MTVLALTPIELTPGGGSPLDLLAELTASALGSNTGITFPNTGHEVVFVQTGSAGSTTVTSQIGTTIEGQTVPGVAPASAQAASKILAYGPYPSAYDSPQSDGEEIVEVDFGTPASVTGVIVVRQTGVY